jgi:hypothetical protein
VTYESLHHQTLALDCGRATFHIVLGEGRDERSDLVLTVVCLRPVTLFAAEGKRIWPRSTMRIFTHCGGEGMGGHNQIWYLSSDIFAESHPVCSRRKEEDKADIS